MQILNPEQRAVSQRLGRKMFAASNAETNKVLWREACRASADPVIQAEFFKRAWNARTQRRRKVEGGA